MALIDSLIDKQDNYEIIRDQVAQILADEVVNQKSLATAAGKDPAQWDFLVFTERTNPFELAESILGKIEGDAEFANVWLDNLDISEGDTVNRQMPTTTIQIDCVSSKAALDNAAGGIATTADERASLDAERIGRLVRNILMSANYTYLDLRGIVGKRWISRMTKLQPDRDDQPVQASMAFRATLQVVNNEFTPQITPGELDEIVVDIRRGELSEILASMTIDLT